MALTWTEIRLNAQKFAHEWRDETYERGECQSFYNEFFGVFGVRRRTVARYEEHVKTLADKSGFIDLFWPGVLLVEHKSYGKSLIKAAVEAGEYFDALPEDQKPRYQLVSDFQTFELLDREANEHIEFNLEDLHQNVERFAFILGRQPPSYRVLEPVNLKASQVTAKLHAILKASGYSAGHLERFLVRIVFCLFADNTGIFQPRGIFVDLLEAKTQEDGSDLGQTLTTLFQILDQDRATRQKGIDPDFDQFPYINGGLFSGPLQTVFCDKKFRDALLAACAFDWSKISPAIFGSLFQAVLSKAQRRDLGSYVTTEANILKVLDDLFLRDLRDELESAKQSGGSRAAAIELFLNKLSEIAVFDPACGSGNFLAIAYREIRRLELDALVELNRIGALNRKPHDLSRVDVDQFFGIEKHSYSARIAETALWMTDHLLNVDLSARLGVTFERVPLRKGPRIEEGDALSMNWHSVIAPSRCSFIVGNPPYKGAKQQSKVERMAVRKIANLGGSGGTLDLVAGWLLKAAEYAADGARIGFVTTNSVTQGEQVGQLWPLLFDRYGLEIAFAHQSFAWTDEAQGRAVVHVVIIGLFARNEAPARRPLYSYPSKRGAPTRADHGAISPYLIPGNRLGNPHLVVRETTKPISPRKRMLTGTKPIDGGYYIFSDQEKQAFLQREPAAQPLFRPFIGTNEFLGAINRHILYLPDSDMSIFSQLKEVVSVIGRVRDYRLRSIGDKDGGKFLKQPNDLAKTPRKFHITVVPNAPFLVVPEVSSERREFLPIDWRAPPTIPSNLVKIILNASLVDFALLTSSMHMAWMRIIGGRLENRYRYSIGLVYNTFPMPVRLDSQLAVHAQAVIDARAAFPGQTLESLYDPNLMPAQLRSAHKQLDTVIDRSYRSAAFGNDEERVEFLLPMYEQAVAGNQQLSVKLQRKSRAAKRPAAKKK